ncbi:MULTISPECIES: formate dehydrogenase accessory sulfurtransferase FdhD [unclassified Aureispira]|uniref:formate dehydrogenase accessory sulfurtransferase FdhD n=1 Tax=unclassified Aureispira TaxID=2649989 RepID=UPI000698B5A8|nr:MULTISPECIES: formate dehydrogenase accessory sulfurtransferase FdhD [unclassified Aureispira]WMX16481.1 formate dehydrogenase accessory sulfurtransferase FdhD [Aureispira sp. CCB-E]
MATSEYQGQKYLKKQQKLVQDVLTVEEALQITINNFPFTVTMRTPGNDRALVRGLLFSEDIYRGDNAALTIDYRQKNAITRIANVSLDKSLLGAGIKSTRNLLSVSSCGICGRQDLDEQSTFKDCLTKKVTIDIEKLYQSFELMRTQQDNFLRSGGSHAAAAFSKNGEMLSLMEDIGRHNAVDKVIGDLIWKEALGKASYLLVSGRISYEIVSKAFCAQIPILAAVSAPSSLAVEYAKQFGLTLLGFCREERATCYANDWRLAIKG